MTSPVRAAIYVRQSLDKSGDELAISRQGALCRKLAAQRGWTVTFVYEDNDLSASKREVERPAYERMRADYLAGHIDAVIAYDLDRWTRQPAEMEWWLEQAEDRGLLAVTVTDNLDLSTDNGRLYVRIKIAVARAEVERKAQRQRDAAAQRAELGKPPVGAAPFGYTRDHTISEPEATLVRKVFARFVAGDSLRSVTAWLNESKHRPRNGTQWWQGTVRNMLRNPRYAAINVYRGEEVGPSDQWSPIVDEATLRAAQHKLADPRRRTQQGTDRRYLGGGLYLCGKCGGPMTSFSQERYRCGDGGRCLSRKRPPVDAHVRAVMRRLLGRADLADLLPQELSAEAQTAAEEVTRLRARLAQVEQDYDADLIDGRRYKAKTEKIKVELAEAETRQARVAGTQGLASVLGAADPVAAFDGSPLMVQRAVIDSLCTVTLLPPATPGRAAFDPESVRVEPRRHLAG